MTIGTRSKMNKSNFDSWAKRYEWIIGENDYRRGGEANGGYGDDLRIWVSVNDEKSKTLTETYTDYNYHWTSEWHDVNDRRIKLGYQMVSMNEDIYDYRPVYQTTTKDVMVVNMKAVTVWETQPIIQEQTVLRTVETAEDATSRSYGEFDSESIKGSSITITTGGDVILSGKVTAEGKMEINAGELLKVKGNIFGGQAVTSTLTAGSVDLSAGG